jgi:hypothetical protein
VVLQFYPFNQAGVFGSPVVSDAGVNCGKAAVMAPRIFLAPPTLVYTAVHQSLRYHRREQKMIEPDAGAGRPPVALVFPECPERSI